MNSLFVVQHLHKLPNGDDDLKLIGVYSSNESAHAAIGRLKGLPSFCEHPNFIDPSGDSDGQGFHVGEYAVDEDYWTEGYVTL